MKAILGWLSFCLCTVAAFGEPQFLAVKKVVVGSVHSCALLEDGKIKCWGSNRDGQLGYGNDINYGMYPDTMEANLPYVDLGADSKATDLCAGVGHTCALTGDGSVKCWGLNNAGQLGNGSQGVGHTPDSMGSHLQKVDLGLNFNVGSLACGGVFTCAESTDHRLKCWGDNQYGQLGVGSSANSIGMDPKSMGDALPNVDLGVDAKIKQLTAGSSHLCALLDNGNVKCWGANAYGQLGYGDMVNRGSKVADMGTSLPYVDLGAGASADQISAGWATTCVHLGARGIKCWGHNGDGNLGLGDALIRGNKPGTMGELLPTVPLGMQNTANVFSFSEHSCVESKDSKLKCWGVNDSGQLGMGDRINRGLVKSAMGNALRFVDLGLPIRSVANGVSFHSCVVLVNNLVKCWGSNGYGQLGLGDNVKRGASPLDMGENLPFIQLQ